MRYVISAILLALALTGCSSEHTESVNLTDKVNREPAELVIMPEWAGNIYTKCDHGNRIYMYAGGTPMIAVVPHGCELENNK